MEKRGVLRELVVLVAVVITLIITIVALQKYHSCFVRGFYDGYRSWGEACLIASLSLLIVITIVTALFISITGIKTWVTIYILIFFILSAAALLWAAFGYWMKIRALSYRNIMISNEKNFETGLWLTVIAAILCTMTLLLSSLLHGVPTRPPAPPSETLQLSQPMRSSLYAM